MTARAVDSSQFDAYGELLMGRLSVCPATRKSRSGISLSACATCRSARCPSDFSVACPGIEEDRVAELHQHLALAHLDGERAGADGIAQPRDQRAIELVALLGLRVHAAQRVHLVLRRLQVAGELLRVGAQPRDLIVALVALLAQLVLARVRGAELVLRLRRAPPGTSRAR